MKPISITMQGFGSYIQPVTIDFTLLGENPIFLITGATGGGKTTILDAMCFALYCKATGGRRSWSSMRSTAADDSLRTFVDFTFQLGGDIYRFFRSQSVYYVRGSGRRDIREEHTCHRLTDGLPTDKNAKWELLISGSETKVRDYAEQLLGLDCTQFSQVIVLPQGDFLKLLLANSKEKADILETLFSTQLWSQIAEKVKQHTNNLSREMGDFLSAKEALLKQEEAETTEVLEEKYAQTDAALHTLQAKAKQLQTAAADKLGQLNRANELARKFAQKSELEQSRAELQTQEPQIEETNRRLIFAKKVEQLYPYWQSYQNTKQILQAKHTACQAADADLQKALARHQALKAQQESVLEKKEKIAKLEQQLPALEKSMQTRKRIQNLQIKQWEQKAAITKKENECAQTETQIAQIEERLQKGKLHLQTIEAEQLKLPEYREQLRTLQTYEQQYAAWRQIKTEQEKASQDFDSALAAKQKKEHTLTQKQQEISHIQSAVLEHSAFVLAQELQENMPCPVCGALQHPAPALQHGTAQADADRLPILKKEEAQLQIDYRQYLQEFSRIQAALEEKTKQLTNTAEICRQIPVSYDSLCVQLKQKEAQIHTAQELIATKEKAEARLQALTDEQNRLQTVCEQKKEEIAQYRQEYAATEASIKELTNAVEFPRDTADIEQQWNQVQTELQQLKEAVICWDALWTESSSDLAVQQTNAKNAVSARQEAETAEEKNRRALELQLLSMEESPKIDINCNLESLRASEQDIQEWENAVQEHTTQTQTVLHQLQLLNKELQGQKEPDVAPLKTEYALLQQEQEALSLQTGAQTQQLESIRKALAQLKSLAANSKEAEAKLAQANRLHQLLSGGNAKKIPIRLFVLGIMLDDILAFANEFFSMLSRGRYSLRRLEGSTGGNAKSGLDLEVLDGFTGAPRSIETLSGGEQFLASLSLAFGLSDVVQSYSGSVRLDSIFIDQGFGSLDQDTLDTAMKALSQIQKTGRTVGIISHVSELKKRIAAQIQVQPSKNGGSSITVIKDI